MISYFSHYSYTACAAFLTLTLLISLLFVILTNKSLFDLAKQDPKIFNEEKSIDLLELEEGE